jgi:hypothetical protein
MKGLVLSKTFHFVVDDLVDASETVCFENRRFRAETSRSRRDFWALETNLLPFLVIVVAADEYIAKVLKRGQQLNKREANRSS